jgi:predicted NUDIX family phosphoesterase
MTIQTTSIPQASLTHDEHILVIKRTALFSQNDAWQGLRQGSLEQYLPLIEQEKEFLPRSQMEMDPRYKQIIPYLIFTYENKYFLMQRQAKASEQRLKNKYSLGIGGHIREEDITGKTIIEWAQREFDEEVQYTGSYTVTSLGILNDDSNPVGEVHVGFVLLLEGTSPDIKVNSELKSGQLLSLDECAAYYDAMENWTQIVFDVLKKRG